MSPETTLLVQQSFRWLLPEIEAAGADFAARLEREAPRAARMLKLVCANERRRLTAAFAFVIWTMDDPDNIRPILEAAGARLARAGATGEDYALFRRVLLAVLARALGRVWNPHLADAWTEALEELCAVTQACGDDRLVAA